MKKNDGNVKNLQRKYHIYFLQLMQRYYIQSALNVDTREKNEQESKHLNSIGDNFKKVIVVKDNIKLWYNDDGILIIGIEEIGEFKRWIVNVLAIKDDDKKVLEEKITSKEEDEMGNFMKVLHEYYDDGVRDGMERGRIEGMEQGIERGMKRGRIEGMEQGIERGMKRGRIEGMEQGIKREKVEFIKRLLKNKLKIKLSKDIMSKIDNASNKELNEIEKRIFEINSIEEVIDIFA